MTGWTTYVSPSASLPELHLVGRAITRNEGWQLPSHHHGAMEISYLHRGAVQWWVEDESTDLRGGDAYVTWPGEEHGGSLNALGGCELYWLQIAVPDRPGSDFFALPPPEAERCLEALRRLPRRFPAPDLSDAFSRVLGRLGQPDDLTPMQVRADVLGILAAICDAARRPASPLSSFASDAIDVMRGHRTSALPASAIAAALGVSVSHFRQRFRREIGVSPAEYHLRLRIDDAKRRLRSTDDPITTIAVDLGFASSQYFATAFKRTTGVTPSQFRLPHDDDEWAILRQDLR